MAIKFQWLLVTCYLPLVCVSIKWTRVVDMDNRIITITGKEYTCNKVQCAVECSKLLHCYSFSYDVISDRCVLYDDVISNGVLDIATKSRYFVSTERQKISVPCPEDYIQDSGLCFKIFKDEYFELSISKFVCDAEDAGLIVLDSQEKSDVLNPYLELDNYYLIGLHGIHYGDSLFEWVDGVTEVNYTNWAPEEPSKPFSYALMCANIGFSSLDNAFRWFAYDCKNSQSFICQITPFQE